MLSTIIGVLITALLAMIGWLFQLGTRVTVLESKHIDLKELINVKLDDISRRLDRIEKGMNGLLSH